MLSSCLLVTTDSQAYRNTHTLRPPAEQIDMHTYLQTITHTHIHTHTYLYTYTHTVKHTRPKGNRSARRPAAMRGFSGCGC
jgi:hypothetical protein